MSGTLSEEGLDLIFRTARTYNGYLDKPVSEGQLRAIWDLMKMGPTSANMSPGRVIWCVSQESKDKLAALSSGTNGAKIRKAPVTAIIGYDLDFHEKLPFLFPHNPDAKNWYPDQAEREWAAFRNGSLQGAYFIIAARALGLDTGPMSGFDNPKVDAEFFAGTTIKSNFISTRGYGDPATIFERFPRFPFEEANSII
jgi:3-hydroxypropanoate dehydrogenase